MSPKIFLLPARGFSCAWDKSWIVWPVAGVAYGVVLAIVRMLKKNH
ncbi:MAG: hypothetical protein IKP72_02475 [Clostridia bacterium]|nr:hypothetical protein [Clostridia bacterium]